MISISFTPAYEGDQCVVSLPFNDLAPRRNVEAHSLAECEVYFADACAYARSMSAAEVREHFKGERKGGIEKPLVSVHLAWTSRARKPSGFLKRRWTAYVEPMNPPAAESVPQAAE